MAVPPGEERLALLPLLFLADSAEDHVRAHLDDGTVYGLLDDDDDDVDDGGPFVGAVQCVGRGAPEPAGTVELTLVAVAEDRHGRGVGQRMLALVLDELRSAGFTRALVGTSNAGIGEIAYYQKCGFRLLSVERDHFDEARGYDGTETENGIVHRDLVWFDQALV